MLITFAKFTVIRIGSLEAKFKNGWLVMSSNNSIYVICVLSVGNWYLICVCVFYVVVRMTVKFSDLSTEVKFRCCV